MWFCFPQALHFPIREFETGPGLTIFTRIFRSASSFAAIWAILFNAPLVAEYTLAPKFEAVATVEEVNTTAAPLAKCGISFCSVKKWPFTLVLNCASKSASVTCSIGVNTAIPALRNRTSNFSPFSTTAFSRMEISANFEVSETIVFNFALLMSSAAFCRFSAFLPVIQTLAPALINAFAVANPIPVVPL